MDSIDKERADFEAWARGKFELHREGKGYLFDTTQYAWEAWQARAGREAERAEVVTGAEPVRAALEAAHKLLQPRLGEPDRTVFWLVVDALHDLKFWGEHPPKPEPSPDVEPFAWWAETGTAGAILQPQPPPCERLVRRGWVWTGVAGAFIGSP